jgi:TatD DNase family protein
MLAHEKVVALGEIGMDFYHPAPEPLTEEEYRARQEEVFRSQLELAAELNLGVVIHQRNSFDAIMEIMEPFHGAIQAVFHCFSGDLAQAESLLRLGHLISFTGIVTYDNAGDVQETARAVPLDRFMVETDAPYLAPVPFRGKQRCQPAHTRVTAEHIASLRAIPLEDLAAATTSTAEAFFSLPR